MDVKYSYYNTSKGYRVTGGTAAHFLKADGSLDNAVYTTVNQADSKYVPFNGSPFNINLNTKNINNAGIVESTALKNNSSTLQVKSFVLQSSGAINSIGIKLSNAGTSNMMGSFTVTIFGYTGQTISFRLSMYKYLNNWFSPSITWIHGDSSKISNIEFYKEDDTNLHMKVNFVTNFGAYNKTVITDVLATGGDPLHNPDTYTISMNPDNSAFGAPVQTISNAQIVRDTLGDAPKTPIFLSTSDLNTILTPGFYNQTTDALATVLRNYPITNAGSLNVYKSVGTGVIQEYTTYNSVLTYRRSYTGGLWTPWRQLIDSLNGGIVLGALTLNGNLNVVNNSTVLGSNVAVASVPVAGSAVGTHNTVMTNSNQNYGLAFGSIANGIQYIQATRFDNVATNYELRLNPNGGTVTFGGAINTSSSDLLLQRSNVNRFRAGTIHTIISAQDTGQIYLRPQGDAVSTGEVIINPSGNIVTSNYGTADAWNGAVIALNNVPRQGTIDAGINSIRVLDTRDVNPLPSINLGTGVWFDFKLSATIGLTGAGLYASAITMAPYGDNSGNVNAAFRLAQSADELYFQNYASANTWGSFRKMWTDKHFTQTNINNWNTAFNWGNHANAGYATTAQLGLYIPLIQRGAANGVATLDAAGLIPTTQLPSYVDDVIEGASLAVINALPANEKQTGKIYVTTDTNKSYRWSGSVFVEISSGAVQSVNGQTGVVNLTYSDVGASAVNHTHTIAQVTGLQSALDGKVDDSQVLTNVPAGAVFTDTIYTLPTATSTNKGGVEIFSDTVQTVASNAVTATASRTYGIQLNSAGQAVVNVPWVNTNTSYTAGNGLTLTGTEFSLPITVSGTGNYITDVAQNANGITVTKGNLPSYSLTVATSTSLGGIRLFSDVANNMAPNSVTEIKGRSYAVQLNNNNQAVVNVPWTDSNTIYTSSNGIVLSGTNFTPTYGTTVNTVAQGNDSRINNGETAFGWGNHANAGYITNSALLNYYTKNESLNLFVKSSGVETISDTKTFTHSPVIPNGTLGAHAINKSQIELITSSESEGGQQLYISGNNSVNLTNYFVTSRDGSRNPDDIAPNSTPRRVRFDFANSTSAGLGGSGNYAGIMTFAPWDGTTASTGDSSYQLAFANQSGSNGAGAPMLKLRKGIDDKWGKWTKFWTDADFTNLNIQQWNYASQYGLKLNEEFSINTGSRLMLADGFYGNESGMMDHTFERFVSGKQNEYYKYGSLYGNFDGLNFNVDTQLFGMGRDANKDDKLTVEGSVKASKNFKSEDENPDTLFIPNGNLATLRDEIVNDQSDYAIRLDPHEYNIDPSGVLAVDDRNRLIHIIGEQVKMTVDFKRVYPKQQIVIYNFDQSGGTMAVKIQGKLIANLSARCFLRLYVTKSQRVIAERQQPCDFVW